MSKKSVGLKPKFKVGDIVKIRSMPRIIEELERCGIYYSEALLTLNGEIIEVDNSDDLPYNVRFNNEVKDCYYLPESLLELVTTEKPKKVEETVAKDSNKTTKTEFEI